MDRARTAGAGALNVEAAAAYAERHELQALLVTSGGRTVFERYAAGWDAQKPHALYSGTKSFWGVCALAAQTEGLLSLDERVAETFPAWRDDARKAQVTLRELLQLTSGIGFGGLGSAVPTYEKALAVELKNEPGTTFTYGGIPLQVFGAVLQQKLAPRGQSPHDYLRARVLDPIGLAIASWRTLKDGTHPLPTGAFLAAAEWLKFGRLVATDRGLRACFTGSKANRRYGLAFWLSPLPTVPDLVYASGSGGQAMYVIPSSETVVVKFGNSSSYKHEAFLTKLLT
jgi:CubicO group peptidase (beta-lactamase class C family)